MIGLRRRRTVERGVASTAQQPRRQLEQRSTSVGRRIECPHKCLVRKGLRPRHVEGVRTAAQHLDRALVRWRQRAQDADARVEHEPRSRHAGQQ